MSQQPVPDGMFEMPADATEAELPIYGAQFAIQAIMMSLGTRDVEPGHTAVSTELVMRSLAMAVATMVTGDDRFATPRDVREEVERVGKLAAGFAKIMRETNDQTGPELLAFLGLSQREIPLN